MQASKWSPKTAKDVFYGLEIRLQCCAVPFALIVFFAHWAGFSPEPTPLRAILYWYTVVVIPAAGLLLDLWRLQANLKTPREPGDLAPTP